MSLTREDMLRELELLPMWRLRHPPAVEVQEIEQAAVVEQVAPEKAIEVQPVDTTAETTALPIVPDAGGRMEELALGGEAVSFPQEVVAEPAVQTTWLLYCPEAEDAACQALLQNILKAMQLPKEQVLLHQQQLTLAETRASYGVLFGLQAANAFLGTQHADIEQVRGQLLVIGESTYLVTHHPADMLNNPALKKIVWHDLCLLLAKK